MNQNPEQRMTLDEAAHDLGKLINIADKHGEAYICINGVPRYKLIDVENDTSIEMTEEERIEFVMSRVFKRYRKAYEELAK